MTVRVGVSLSHVTIAVCVVVCLVSGAAEAQGVNGGGLYPRSPRVLSMDTMALGARPKISPDGTQVVYDTLNQVTGYYDVVIADYPTFANKRFPFQSNPTLPDQRNRGAAAWHPGGAYIVFGAEVQTHLSDDIPSIANPGLGNYTHIWSYNVSTGQLNQLTNNPVKLTAGDGIEVHASLFGVFDATGDFFYYTHRYQAGTHAPTGDWRIEGAAVTIAAGNLTIGAESTIYTPATGWYVVLMTVRSTQPAFCMASNHDGQAIDGMDIIAYNSSTTAVTKITDTPANWEEGSVCTPGGGVVFMSDYNLVHGADVAAASQREFFYVPTLVAGQSAERLTFYNSQPAPEAIISAADQPTGRYQNAAKPDYDSINNCILGTVGENTGTVASPAIKLFIKRICFRDGL